MSYTYTYEIDGIAHQIKSINPIKTADSNGVIPISAKQSITIIGLSNINEMCYRTRPNMKRIASIMI